MYRDQLIMRPSPRGTWLGRPRRPVRLRLANDGEILSRAEMYRDQL